MLTYLYENTTLSMTKLKWLFFFTFLKISSVFGLTKDSGLSLSASAFNLLR